MTHPDMTRPELDRMLEKAVADAIGVSYRNKSTTRTGRQRVRANGRQVQSHHNQRELQHA
jgi:hypothetical protein